MNPASPLRTLLAIGRVAGLPTVWSNCLAGWWLGGGGNYWKLPFLFLGTSALYTGGAFLNDAFDEEFDRQRRAERPIPTGRISASRVWRLGFGQLALGIVLLFFCGKVAAVAAVLLALSILLYDWAHRLFIASPWLMGACRFWVYAIAGATGMGGLNGFVVFCGAALAIYVVGLGCVARKENGRRAVPLWPLPLLAAPIMLALLMNAGEYSHPAGWVSLVLGLWVARCVRPVIFQDETSPGWIVANLLAGIMFVDWLSVAPQLPPATGAIVFLALFGLAKWLQKSVPSA